MESFSYEVLLPFRLNCEGRRLSSVLDFYLISGETWWNVNAQTWLQIYYGDFSGQIACLAGLLDLWWRSKGLQAITNMVNTKSDIYYFPQYNILKHWYRPIYFKQW